MTTGTSNTRPTPRARRRAVLAAALVAGLAGTLGAGPSLGGELPRPEGRVILTLTGAIANTNAPGRAELDYAMLEGIGLVTRAIDTPWTDAGSRFEGVPARALIDYVGASGRWVEAVAANDYRVDVPMSDLVEHDTLFALSRDGRRMRLRDKGPVWLLYDNEDRPDVDEQDLMARMVWQIRTLEVVE